MSYLALPSPYSLASLEGLWYSLHYRAGYSGRLKEGEGVLRAWQGRPVMDLLEQ